MKQFIYVLKPSRDNFANTTTPEEEETISIHFNYLKDLLDKKILIMAGPETSGKFGLAVIETETEEEARKIMENDPAVGKVFTAELYPYRVSLLRK